MSRDMLQYVCQVLLKKGDDHDLSGSIGKRKKDHSQLQGMSGMQRAGLREYPARSGIQGARPRRGRGHDLQTLCGGVVRRRRGRDQDLCRKASRRVYRGHVHGGSAKARGSLPGHGALMQCQGGSDKP